jgi:hypothetical protein
MRLAFPLATRRASLVLLALAALGQAAPAPAAAVEPAEPPPVVEERPVFATSGWRRPVEARAGCVTGALVAPADLVGQIEVTVKFAVGTDGSVDRFEDVSTPAAPEAVVAALSTAVRSCAYQPGADPEGRPAYVWVLLTVKVGTPAKKGPAARAAGGAAESKDLRTTPMDVSKDEAAAPAPPPPARKPKPGKKAAPAKE